MNKPKMHPPPTPRKGFNSMYDIECGEWIWFKTAYIEDDDFTFPMYDTETRKWVSE